MLVIGRPLYFEDRTGQSTNTDLDDIYDRMFLRVVQHTLPGGHPIVLIYDRGRRSRKIHNPSGASDIRPSVVLDFGLKGNGLGSIVVGSMPGVPMKDYLRKVGTWGRYVGIAIAFGIPLTIRVVSSSHNRKFIASDSNEYRWSKSAIEGQAWTVRTVSRLLSIIHPLFLTISHSHT
jgi:hypothetical protein